MLNSQKHVITHVTTLPCHHGFTFQVFTNNRCCKKKSKIWPQCDVRVTSSTTQLYTSLRALLRQLFYPASAGYWKSTYHCVLLHGWVTWCQCCVDQWLLYRNSTSLFLLVCYNIYVLYDSCNIKVTKNRIPCFTSLPLCFRMYYRWFLIVLLFD